MRLGKNKYCVSIVILLLYTASAYGQADKSYKYQLNGNVQKNNIISENRSVIINYSIPELYINSFQDRNESFYRIAIPGHISSSDPGKPELPVFSSLISIPEGCIYTIRISDVSITKLKPSKKKFKGVLYPAQEGETKAIQKQKPPFKMDKNLYSSRGVIAEDTVRIEPLGKAHDMQLANLSVSPVRYDPRLNVLEVITSMKIEISFSEGTGSISKSISSGAALFNKSLSKEVLNYNQEDFINGYSDQPVKMVILTDTIFRKHLDPIIKWKTQKGYKLKILYKGANLAGNSYTQIKDTLTKIYNASTETDPPPEYLLIIGDINKVPYYGSGNVTDMYYGEFTGNGDYIPEMYIGRIPVTDTTELKSVINKIIRYEKCEFADTNNFYSRALVTAGNDAGYYNYMNGQVKYAISNYLTTGNKIEEHHFYYPQSATAEDSIKKLLKKGISFLNFTGHGSASGWLDPEINGNDIDSLKNKNMYPFIISNACKTSQFNLVSSFGSKFVLSNEKGAIGYIGCSNDSYWDEDFYWSIGLGTPSANPTYETTGPGAYDRLFHTHNESPSDWYYTMGQINYAGNLAVSASTSQRKKYYWEIYNLVGDPSVVPILGKPASFKISLPDTLPNGLKSLSLNIDPFAYIAISHFDTLWDASFASATGSVTLDLPGISDDSCMVVVTGQNKVPLIKSIYFSDINNEYINLSATSINDSLGNNNGRADFGESFYLKLAVSNLGLTDASDLYAIITSPSGLVTINNDSVKIDILRSGSEIILSNDFGMTIADDVPDLETVPVYLTLKDQKSEKLFTIDICIHAPKLQMISCKIDDTILGNGNHIADPGENFNLVFKIINEGSSDISGDLSLTSLNENLSIDEPSVKSGVLKFGESFDIPVKVKLLQTVPSGAYISVSSLLKCSPYTLNKDFTFRVGKIRESFEAESFNVFPWINVSSKPWTITQADSYEGIISAKSGAISKNGTSSLIIRSFYPTYDSVKFYYKVSSEFNYDYLSFRINGVEIFKKSGEINWTKMAVPVTAGLNKMEWVYYKDNGIDSGSDCAWIDMIDFAGPGTVSYIQKDLEVARIVTPIQKDKFGHGTITVKVLNIGKDTIDGFNLAYSLNKYPYSAVQHFKDQIIPYSDSVSVSFTTKADMSKLGIYNIAAYGYNNNDDYLLNDTIRLTIENTDISDSLIIYPNPFIDHLNIFINSKSDDRIQISLTNVTGAKIYVTEKDIFPGKNEIIISDRRLKPSLYFLNIRGTTINKTVSVVKIIK
ncbi:MAG: C25 family cysteine peptidase [Bacteroidales bacterium]|nr:C25 family cysteine peptidase [Bacteroidales bacterium]